MDIIKSYYFKDQEILEAINRLHLNNSWIDLDPTFSIGSIYKGLPEPRLKYDLQPKRADVKKANSAEIPLGKNSVGSILFDPPFMWGIRPSSPAHNNNQAAKRFTMYKKFADLENHYNASLMEFHRLLKKNGILIFKCQDFTDKTTTLTHCLVYKWAIEKMFSEVDFFIRLVKWRIYNSKLRQRHSRKYHSYYYVFKKNG